MGNINHKNIFQHADTTQQNAVNNEGQCGQQQTATATVSRGLFLGATTASHMQQKKTATARTVEMCMSATVVAKCASVRVRLFKRIDQTFISLPSKFSTNFRQPGGI